MREHDIRPPFCGAQRRIRCPLMPHGAPQSPWYTCLLRVFKQTASKWSRRLLLWPLASIGLVVVVVTVTPLVTWYANLLAGDWSAPDGQVLIVLGGSYFEPDIISEDTYWRCVYALRLFRRGHFKRVVVVGHGVAENMRQFLAFQGVPADAIYLETHSNSTHENAIYTARMLASVPGTKVLMTSDYHMFRALHTFERAGIDVLTCPIPHSVKLAGSWQTRWLAFLDEGVESVKIVYYATRQWI